MSYLKITNAGLQYKDEVFAGTEMQNITHFVFANVPGLDPATPISADATIPATHVVHEEPIKRVAALDGNAVVISCVLGYEIGNFDFNWFGAVATKANGDKVLIGVVQTALQTKTKTVGNNIGNYTVKSIVWQTQNIADSLNITLAALPWQVNGETAFVSRDEFNSHNHDDSYLGKTAKAESAKDADKLGGKPPSFYYSPDNQPNTPFKSGALVIGRRHKLNNADPKTMPDTTNLNGDEWLSVKVFGGVVPRITVNDPATEQFKRLQDDTLNTFVDVRVSTGAVDTREIVFVWNKTTKMWEF